MKILFVCRANVGRSQMAAELYYMLCGENAESAGTKVPEHEEGQLLSDRPSALNVILAMKELHIDISENQRHQLNPNELKRYDKVIVMAEPENIPEWLSESDRFEYWPMKDTKNQDLETTRRIRDDIKATISQWLVQKDIVESDKNPKKTP